MFKQLPNKVTLTEVGPRDGFQNVKTFIPTEDKVAIIEGLITAGVKSFELTSFVSPKAIPQLADAAEVCRTILSKHGDQIDASALVPNLRGAQSAWEAGIREVACVISVSTSHNRANINRTHDESIADLAKMLESLPKMTVRVDLATAFACPFEGWIQPEAVRNLAERIQQLGIRKMVLADTIGVATPDRVYALSTFMRQQFPDINFALHLHDTRGTGLANTLAGLMAGITTFETSIAGLGGCPFAPGAAGNTATEDTVNMLRDMKIETGVSRDKLIDVVSLVAEKVDAPINSHLAKAKLYECLN
ncbi:MAG: hydroxymethylglutaryl-CoA lyase [Negativicutes bacterium]